MAVPRSPAVRTVPAGRLLAATRMVTFLAEDWKTRSGHGRAHQHQGDAEADLPRTALVGPVDEIRRPPAGSRPSGGGGEGGRAGAVVMAIGSPVPQLLTDSIWATSSEVVPWVVRLGRAHRPSRRDPPRRPSR